MKITPALFAAFAMALFLSAGCSGVATGSFAAGPAASAGGSVRQESVHLLYVSTAVSSSGYVSVFKQGDGHPQVLEITQGLDEPFGLFVDKQGHLYATNAANGTVTVYARGAASPFETLTGAGAPIDVVVAPDGTVYVVNDAHDFGGSIGGSVLEYAQGKTKPSKTVVTFEAKKTWPRAVALDAANDLYVSFNHEYGASWKPRGGVLEFSTGSPGGKDLGIRVGEAGGLTIDKRGNVVLVTYGNSWYFPPTVSIFAPGSRKPWKVIPFPGGWPGYDVALNQRNTEMWLTCPSPQCGAVFGLTYPDGAPKDTIEPGLGGFVVGVATSPDGSQ